VAADDRPAAILFFGQVNFADARGGASALFVRGSAQFLNLSGGPIGKIKLAHRLQFINGRARFAVARR